MFEKKPTAVFGTIAPVGSPVGHLGIEVERNLLPFLAISGGVGAGGSGPQLAAALRARGFGGERWAVGVGAGFSGGKAAQLCFGLEECPAARTILWSNVEAAVDVRLHVGLSMRFAIGGSLATACWGNGNCPRASLTLEQDLLVYHTVAVGYAW